MPVDRAIDLTGFRFSRLLVLQRAPRGGRKNRRAIWTCRCDCGNISDVGADRLKSGSTKSCGCLSREVAIHTHATHGCASSGTVTREYLAWANMRARCSGAQPKSWKNYGGRGIAVCADWQNSFAAFLGDVGESPGKGWELDRIDNDGDYEPGNVRWVTKSENNKNRRSKAEILGGRHVS